jgi:hypothetical protein
MTLRYIEDYLEFLYGSLDKDGVPIQSYSYVNVSQAKIKLATYDKSPVASMGSYCQKARLEKTESCLTDRQVELAKKIILKYKRQFLSQGITLPEDDALELRHPTRSIDRSKYLEQNIETKTFTLKFPYDPKKISYLHDYQNKSAGNFAWNNTARKWEADLTEVNLATVVELFKTEDLKIDDSLVPVITDVLNAGKKDLPTLVFENNEMALKNCHLRVFEYLDSINFNKRDNDLAYWVSIIINLGIELDQSILDKLSESYSPNTVEMIASRKVVLPSSNQSDGPWLESLFESNQALSKFPWVLYLTWWSNKTDWSKFSNVIKYEQEDKNNFKVSKKFADLLLGLDNPIIVVDSIIGRDAVRNFIESNSLKIVYISDIGHV